MVKRNIVKKMMAVLVVSTGFVISTPTSAVQKSVTQRNKECVGNIIKAAVAAYTSLLGASYYYETIVYPYMVARAQKNGLGDAISFNVNFVLNDPIAALYFATPLFASIVSAFIARDYANKVWHEEEQDDDEEELQKDQGK